MTANPVAYETGFERASPSGASMMYVVTTAVMNRAGSRVIQYAFLFWNRYTVMAHRTRVANIWLD
ncbi:hypothetical protein [Petrimonas sulfuriphila]|uniref:hypothetical protein n=1 Tax=Petrimonas sulfuriphila TaxID=285070 RepID=UPI003F5169FF